MKFNISNDYFSMDLNLIINDSKKVFEREEKEKKRIKLICDGCGKIFELNVLFDKNGDSVEPVRLSRLCSKCINKICNKNDPER